MIKYATHNSATGEPGRGIYKLLNVFAKCQKLDIFDQLVNGVKYFDIRIKYYKGEFVLCHGIWIADTPVEVVFNRINRSAYYEDIYVSITLEKGEYDSIAENYISNLIKTFNDIKYTTINVKRPKWKNIKTINNIPTINCYKVLDGSSWHTYLPIPWLWNKIFKFTPKYDVFNFVDFYE